MTTRTMAAAEVVVGLGRCRSFPAPMWCKCVINAEIQKTLGDAVCADLHKGNAAANEVIGVSNDMRMPMSQAEVVVYWAITDLCTDEMSQRQDQWRDGQ